MRLTTIQHQNLLNIRALVLLVADEYFDGTVFEPSAPNSQGCAIHHAFHQGKLPFDMQKYMQENPSNSFGYSTTEMFTTHFGEGSFDLFFDAAADAGDFIIELDKFIQSCGTIGVVVSHVLSNGDVLTVTELGNGSYDVVRTSTSTMTLAKLFALIK